VTAELVVFGHDVEEKRLDVIVERFGAEEELGEETKILAVHGVLAAVDFEDGYGAFSVDFVAWWMLGWAFELELVSRNGICIG
jgi:hypothetical protein